ncbi:MAG TPA: hypothetical protein VHG91_06865 [Longimicrobium sp.]|nr:hypothetical protein [Longimicrobium sp.]
MTGPVIAVCHDARGREWQLGPLDASPGHVTLIGWTCGWRSPDAGVPREVASILARTLTAVARVTFLSSAGGRGGATAESAPGVDPFRSLAESGLRARVRAVLAGEPSGVTLRSTRDAEAAAELFEDAEYPWWLQGQVAVLSAPEAPLPELTVGDVVALTTDEWVDRASRLDGVSGVVRPGVDGDIVGAVTNAPPFGRLLLDTLEREAGDAGFRYLTLSEADFARHLAEG